MDEGEKHKPKTEESVRSEMDDQKPWYIRTVEETGGSKKAGTPAKEEKFYKAHEVINYFINHNLHS
jgi:hypothetical protein